MNKLAIIPIFFLTMCGTAPVTDPPAHACSPRLDGEPTYCPDERDLILVKPKSLIPRDEARGEINIRDPYHWQSLQLMFQKNMRKGEIEKNATKPADAINKALTEFNYGSDDTTESKELL